MRVGAVSGAAPVLNAFRHHGEGDYTRRSAALGVTGAQRFSASRRGGPQEQQTNDSEAWCSTPFGITARGTRRQALLDFCEDVLNAFRHHGEGDQSSAGPRDCRATGAQRLSASRRGGPLGGGLPLPLPGVLNAFRHHGEGDRRDPRCRGPREQVLNAFRHHGEGDGALLVPKERVGRCSTPFGITARGTSLRAPSGSWPPCAQRLSASRRGGPLEVLHRILGICACSTPFGITARGTIAARIALPA